MTKRMLVDATHPEETRVALVDGNWLNDFDFERTNKKQLKGNIYLAKVIRIEPSLQAAFVEYGGNRHGFLSFSEIHPDYFRIPVGDRPADEETGDDEDNTDTDDTGDGGDTTGVMADTVESDAEEAIEDGVDTELHLGGDVAPIFGTYAESPAETAVAPEMTSMDTLSPLAAFAPEVTDDLGLITDFGNAVVGSDFATAPMPMPETVGGEAMVEEERYRRPVRQRYKIQEVVKRRQVMLIQVVKEERGNKGAALTTFLSLAGRYCVLMPNTESGGGVSRKITSHQDRRRMKEMLDLLEVPEGMAVILRTAGMEQEPAEIQRDLEYLLRLWNNIREQTLQSTAPTLIYEEANLIKRSLRDLYAPDIAEILVAGHKGHQLAVDFMRAMMPDQLDKVKLYEDPVPLFFRYNVEKQIDQLYDPVVQLRSGGYIVINPTEALVSIDVNSGRSTRERHIEGTALKTNLEAAEEVARQLRLRDLAGLVVIDFIDMEDGRNNAAVERRLKDAMRHDRARLQIGRISPFGLLELSRQRLHSSLTEINFEKCPHCAGLGIVRSIDSAAISILRTIEEDALRHGGGEIIVHVAHQVALYILNQKRSALSDIENRYSLQVFLRGEDNLPPTEYKLERVRGGEKSAVGPAVNIDFVLSQTDPVPPPPMRDTQRYVPRHTDADDADAVGNRESAPRGDADNGGDGEGRGGRRRRGRGGFGRNRNNNRPPHGQQQFHPGYGDQPEASFAPVEKPPVAGIATSAEDNIGNSVVAENGHASNAEGNDAERRGRRRGRRGGRGRRPGGENGFGDNQQRPPRDNNFRRGGSRGFDPLPPGVASAAMMSGQAPASHVPMSIHEIDTTPRVDNASRSSEARNASPAPYEVFDHSDKPKGGWWRKLTGQ
jgi:ribonuclease E